MPRLVVCAAIRSRKTGMIICGARHGNCLNQSNRLGLGCSSKEWECGFVDQDNEFMSRKEAWAVADAAGQLRRPTGFERHYKSHRQPGVGDVGLLFSENLY